MGGTLKQDRRSKNHQFDMECQAAIVCPHIAYLEYMYANFAASFGPMTSDNAKIEFYAKSLEIVVAYQNSMHKHRLSAQVLKKLRLYVDSMTNIVLKIVPPELLPRIAERANELLQYAAFGEKVRTCE